MQQQVLEMRIALDTCVIVGIIKSPTIARGVLKLFKGNHSRIVIQDVVLDESTRVLRIQKESILEKIQTILQKEIYIFSTTDQMKKDGQILEKKYGICHSPDSLILAAAKTCDWILLSLDRNLLRTADYEGIQAFNPNRGRGY